METASAAVAFTSAASDGAASRRDTHQPTTGNGKFEGPANVGVSLPAAAMGISLYAPLA
jgi:hypothetical protein